MKKEIEDFLKEKGLLTGKSTKFVVKGIFGVCTLNDLIEEFTSQKADKAYGEGYREGANDIMSSM